MPTCWERLLPKLSVRGPACSGGQFGVTLVPLCTEAWGCRVDLGPPAGGFCTCGARGGGCLERGVDRAGEGRGGGEWQAPRAAAAGVGARWGVSQVQSRGEGRECVHRSVCGVGEHTRVWMGGHT